jgi:uncharacterized membrane protein
MNRAHFMAQLRDGLAGLHHTDISDIVSDYERHFADGAADGRTEEEVAAALGDPVRLARELRAEDRFPPLGGKSQRGQFHGVVLALAGTGHHRFHHSCCRSFASWPRLFFGLAVACLGMVVGGSFLLFNLLLGRQVMGNPPCSLLIGSA